MDRGAFADRDTIMGCLDTIGAANAKLGACSFDALTPEELMLVLARLEKMVWQAPVIEHQILARLVAEGDAGLLGACSLTKSLAERLRISSATARRRIDEAAELGPRTTLTGEPLEPVLPALAAAQAGGQVGPEHVAIARKAYAKIPAAVSAAVREHAEADLAALAEGFGPETFQRLADHLVATLNPNGDFTDRERLAQRSLRLGRQGPDGMSTLSGKITPELRATLEPVLAKLGAPGVCNAADEQPCVSGTPSEEQIQRDDRSLDQRHHDALLALSRAAIAAGDLGQLNGLPVTVIVSTTLAELQAAAGHAPSAPLTPPRVTGKAHTAGGSLLPMTDLLRMAEHAHHYLSVFDGRGRALWLGRSKRIASADQRIVLHARDRGCTRPGCTVSGYLSQAHHLEQDWARNGQTDVDSLALACAPDNRMATEQGWLTRLGDSGRVEWIPPPHLQRGQPRINPAHFIADVIAHIRATRTSDPPGPPVDADRPQPDADRPRPDDRPDDRPGHCDPLPGEPGYDTAVEHLQRSYDTMDLDELANRYYPYDDWAQAG